jgi:hypothetical protein
MKEFWETALVGPLTEVGKSALDFLPSLLAMVIILTVGLLLAWAAGHLVERLLRVIGLDALSNRLGFSAALARGGVKSEFSHIAGLGAYWLVVIFAVMAGLGVLNLEPLNQFARTLLAYLPHLFTAAVILVVGYLLANFISRAVLIAAVNAGLPPARMLAAFSRWGVQLVAIAMALEQLGIAETVVVVGFALLMGGVVLAGAIAFGLGAKELAKEYLERRLAFKHEERKGDDLRHL